jgi:hypothetical protein
MKTLTGKFTDRFGRGTEAHVFFTFRVENEYDLTVRVPRTPAEYRGEPARDLELMASHYVNDPVRIDVAQTLLGTVVHRITRLDDVRPDVCRHCDTTAAIPLPRANPLERAWKCSCGQLIRREVIEPDADKGDDISTAALVMWLDAEAAGRKPMGERSYWLRAAARRLDTLNQAYDAETR